MKSQLRTLAMVLTVVVVGATPSFAQQAGASPDEVAPARPGVRTVYLIRHGEYDHADERDATVGKNLVPLGIAQARLVAARLRGMPVEWSSFRSSMMTRARETALVIGEDFPELSLESTPLLNECTPPIRGRDDWTEEQRTALELCGSRLEKAFNELFAPSEDGDRNDLVVAHGNVIRYFVTRVLEVDAKAWLGMAIANCSLTVVKIMPDGRMVLLSYSDVGHMPPNLQTWTAPGTKAVLSIPLPARESAAQ